MEKEEIIDKVLGNDYIMIAILRMLNYKDQYKLQKICQHFRYLVSCVWQRDCTEVYLNRNQAAGLTTEEFGSFLQLNIQNIKKLTVDELDRLPFQMYFPQCYTNLLELHIKWWLSNDELCRVVKSCPALQVFDYNQCRDGRHEPLQDIESLEPLTALSKLKAVILRKFVGSVSFVDLMMLATRVPLERLELHSVSIRLCEWSLGSPPFVLPSMKVLKIIYERTEIAHWLLALRCPNLQDLQIRWYKRINSGKFESYKSLETLRLTDCDTPQAIWRIMEISKLKNLEIDGGILEEGTFEISQNVPGICANLQSLKVHRQWLYSNTSFWLALFQTPLTNFDNLQELKLSNRKVCDELIHLISLKCPQLKTLHLICCEISGKYLNKLKNLHNMTIEFNYMTISWSSMFHILHDLKLLEFLHLNGVQLERDGLAITKDLKYFNSVLKELTLRRIDMSFWQYVFNKCAASFPNIHKLNVLECKDIGNINSKLRKLSSLYFKHCDKLRITRAMMRRVKHLALNNCILQKPNVWDIVNSSRVETVEIVRTAIGKDLKYPKQLETIKTSRYLRSATVQYGVLVKTLWLWQRYFEVCPTFQLCCIEHEAHVVVLEQLLQISSGAKQRIKAIHGNSDLGEIVLSSTEEIDLSSISPAV